MIWDKVALNQSDILHRPTQNTRNTVLPDTEYFENRVPKLPSDLKNIAQYNAVFSVCSNLTSTKCGQPDMEYFEPRPAAGN